MSKQLVELCSKVTLGDYFHDGTLTCHTYEKVATLCWPDGSPCLLGNAYMLELLNRDLSTRGVGGSVRQYALNISHLLRYCFDNNLRLADLTDSRFTQFINGLRAELDPSRPNEKMRDANTLKTIGRGCLDFLSFSGLALGNTRFVAHDGRIRAIQKKYAVKFSRSHQSVFRTYWDHKSLKGGDPRTSRSPIASDSIERMYEAIYKVGKSDHLYRRRQMLLRCLETWGCRVGELALLRVDDVLVARESIHPMLRIPTLKKRNRDAVRLLPMLQQDLADICRYITVSRSQIIRRTIGLAKDHGYVFVSEVTGKPLSAKTLTNEVLKIRCAAGITEQACAHMFRHRFITKRVVMLIKRYDFHNPDQFRKALLDIEALKLEVLEWTGQSTTAALDDYIDFAFKEISDFEVVKKSIKADQAQAAFERLLSLLVKRLTRGELSVDEYEAEYYALIRNRDADSESGKL
jgi:integrase